MQQFLTDAYFEFYCLVQKTRIVCQLRTFQEVEAKEATGLIHSHFIPPKPPAKDESGAILPEKKASGKKRGKKGGSKEKGSKKSGSKKSEKSGSSKKKKSPKGKKSGSTKDLQENAEKVFNKKKVFINMSKYLFFSFYKIRKLWKNFLLLLQK